MKGTSATTDSSLVLLALRAKPVIWVHSWHATTTINSSLALGDDGFGPKRCGAGPLVLSLAMLGEQILTIFFVSTNEDQWFCAKRYLILDS